MGQLWDISIEKQHVLVLKLYKSNGAVNHQLWHHLTTDLFFWTIFSYQLLMLTVNEFFLSPQTSSLDGF